MVIRRTRRAPRSRSRRPLVAALTLATTTTACIPQKHATTTLVAGVGTFALGLVVGAVTAETDPPDTMPGPPSEPPLIPRVPNLTTGVLVGGALAAAGLYLVVGSLYTMATTDGGDDDTTRLAQPRALPAAEHDDDDRLAVRIWNGAEAGDCALVRRLASQLRARSPAYFREHVASEPSVARCLTVSTPRPSPSAVDDRAEVAP